MRKLMVSFDHFMLTAYLINSFQEEDEEGYRALIDKQKNKRLAFLLDQTDTYVVSMDEMVKRHQQAERDKEHRAVKKVICAEC